MRKFYSLSKVITKFITRCRFNYWRFITRKIQKIRGVKIFVKISSIFLFFSILDISYCKLLWLVLVVVVVSIKQMISSAWIKCGINVVLLAVSIFKIQMSNFFSFRYFKMTNYFLGFIVSQFFKRIPPIFF